ncbi:MAG TPA: class I SAM-dependent methyltransferase [Verrucomicrobiae bacterium]|jgi:SAM-dependent methyltransferase|nr:class I SAM-dependent methyltransferase [Verrucomicrobiae bacterium]
MKKEASRYEFSGREDIVRLIQRPFVAYFRDSNPVLDIGCGGGVFLELLAKAGIEAAGVDRSEEAVSACRARGLRVEQEDAREYLRRSRGQFGGIFCSHVIEHMVYDDAVELLQLCHGALRPNGLLLLITPNPEDLAVISEIFWLDPTHVRPYPRLLLRKMLDSAGFQVKRDRPFLGNWRVIGRRKLAGYIVRRVLLGRHFGKQNTLILAQKSGN